MYNLFLFQILEKTQISENDFAVFDLGSIPNWERLNDEDGITNFSYQHRSGIDYFYIEETLIHSRNGTSTFDKIQIDFNENNEYEIVIYIE